MVILGEVYKDWAKEQGCRQKNGGQLRFRRDCRLTGGGTELTYYVGKPG